MKSTKVVASLVFAGLVVSLLSCGGGSTMTNLSNSKGTARLNVNMGDSPTDSVVSFEIDVTSIVLTGAGGSVPVLSKPAEIELTHLAGTVEPLAVMDVPAGTYTGATITISSAEATVINGSGMPVEVAIEGSMR